jgi:hypothetical protein
MVLYAPTTDNRTRASIVLIAITGGRLQVQGNKAVRDLTFPSPTANLTTGGSSDSLIKSDADRRHREFNVNEPVV